MDEDNCQTFSCQLAHLRLVSILVNVSVTFENLPVLWPITPLIEIVKSNAKNCYKCQNDFDITKSSKIRPVIAAVHTILSHTCTRFPPRILVIKNMNINTANISRKKRAMTSLLIKYRERKVVLWSCKIVLTNSLGDLLPTHAYSHHLKIIRH